MADGLRSPEERDGHLQGLATDGGRPGGENPARAAHARPPRSTEEKAREHEERCRLIFENSPLAILYTDRDGVITTCNERATHLFGAPRERLIGFSCREIQDDRMRTAAVAALQGEDAQFEGEYRTVTGGVLTYMNAKFSPSFAPDGSISGVIGMFEDMAARRQVEKEKEELIEQLRTALGEVKTLRGILPICASCKKIRDDGGYWKRLEEYMQVHTEAQFTHGICPECREKLYPDLVAGKQAQ